MRVCKYTKIQGPRFQRNYIIPRDQKNEFTWHVTSIIAENKLHAHHNSHLHTMNVYNTRTSQFCLLRFLFFFFFRPLSSVHLFQSNQRFPAIEFVNRHVSEKLEISSFLNMRGFDHATILVPSFHSLRKERLAQWPPFASKIRRKTRCRLWVSLLTQARLIGWRGPEPL